MSPVYYATAVGANDHSISYFVTTYNTSFYLFHTLIIISVYVLCKGLLIKRKITVIEQIAFKLYYGFMKHSTFFLGFFHLSQELKQRPYETITAEDLEHLRIDIKRVYSYISIVWVEYLQYLQSEYPYLFLTAITNNPYDNREKTTIEKEVILTK